MDARIYLNLQAVYQKTKFVAGDLLERDEKQLDAHDHNRELATLSEILEHLRIVDRAMGTMD